MPQSCEKPQRRRPYQILRKPIQQPADHQHKCLYEFQSDDLPRIQMPLLNIQNEINSHHHNGDDKNETNAKLNLIHGEHVINDYKEAKAVMLEIEKITPQCSDINLTKPVSKVIIVGDKNVKPGANIQLV